MAGVSNSVWSDDVGLSLRFEVVHGWLYELLHTHGELRALLQTYGFALLLMLSIGLLAGFLGRRWNSASDSQRQFVWKFAGVTVGAYALHLFTLLRSDLSHLAGPSFLLPLFLLMLPPFAWQCLGPGLERGVLLAVSVALVVEAGIVGRTELGRRVEGSGTAWGSAAVLDVYRALWSARDQPTGIASRYSPIPQYQVAFRNYKAFGELEELVGLLRERLQGRPVELVFPAFDGLALYPELLYFFGEFRSVSGITAKESSVSRLKSDNDAWIAKVLASGTSCVFFNSRSLYSRMFEAWKHLDPATVVTQPIVGKRNYGVLSCKV